MEGEDAQVDDLCPWRWSASDGIAVTVLFQTDQQDLCRVITDQLAVAVGETYE